MTRSILKSVLASAMLLGVATAAFAATGEYDNMCTMGLALGKEIKTDCRARCIASAMRKPRRCS